MSEEWAVLPKEVQPGYLVTGKAPKHTHALDTIIQDDLLVELTVGHQRKY